MAQMWLQIRVDLLGGRGVVCTPPAGHIFLVGPAHSFADLACAIDTAFPRWDLAHPHAFELAGG